MIPNLGTHLKTASGDLFTIKGINKKFLQMQIGDTDTNIVGEVYQFPNWFKLNKCTVLTEEEYVEEIPKFHKEQERRLEEHKNLKLKEKKDVH